MKKIGIIIALSPLIGCVQTTSVEHQADLPPVVTTPATPVSDPALKVASKRELLEFVVRLSDANNPFTKEDRGLLELIKARIAQTAKPSKVAEAAIVVGNLRQIIANGPTPTSNTQTNGTTSVQSNSLRELMSEFGVDLKLALARNVALRQHQIYRQGLEALEYSTDSESYKEDVRQVILAEAQSWASLLGTSADSQANGELNEQDLAGAQPNDNAPAPLPMAIADLRRSDGILAYAEKLAEDGSYKKALQAVQQIAESDPVFPTAKEKAKKYSNLAVRDLRKRAAQAYQVAMPSSDLSAKSAYLTEARDLLESAIKDFPEADQIEVVKRNLAVIAQDLSKIEAKIAPKPEANGDSTTNPGATY